MRKYLPDGRRLRPVEVVSDYELIILDELDLGREAANACQLRRNFDNSKLLSMSRGLLGLHLPQRVHHGAH